MCYPPHPVETNVPTVGRIVRVILRPDIARAHNSDTVEAPGLIVRVSRVDSLTHSVVNVKAITDGPADMWLKDLKLFRDLQDALNYLEDQPAANAAYWPQR